jgi:glutathione-regulated potassium-efflux system ancillary protein KefG
MAKVLIIFAHPVLEKSRVQARLIRHLHALSGISFHDLYQSYPDFDINVEREKSLLLSHDVIIWQHPFYWYSAPAILKQWMDLVLEHGWAYGRQGHMLKGKRAMNVISTGGTEAAYQTDGRNRFPIRTLLSPFDQTAHLCHMSYCPPFVVHGTHRLSEGDMDLYATQYEQMLLALVHDRLSENELRDVRYMNELFPLPATIQS